MHPSRRNRFLLTTVAKGPGIDQTAVNPKWEPLSYSPDKAEFNRNTSLSRMICLVTRLSRNSLSHTQGWGVRIGRIEVYFLSVSVPAVHHPVYPELDG